MMIEVDGEGTEDLLQQLNLIPNVIHAMLLKAI